VHKQSKWKHLMESSDEGEPVVKVAKKEEPMEEEDMPPIFTKPPTVTNEEKKTDPKTAWAGLMSKMKPDAPKKAKQPKGKNNKDTKKDEKKPANEKWRDIQADGFDPAVHGYWRTKDGGMVYKHPDGRVTPATGVDAFQPDSKKE